MFVCVCVRACVCEGGREGGRDENDVNTVLYKSARYSIFEFRELCVPMGFLALAQGFSN